MNDTDQVPGASPGWSPHFPHARIDTLLAQLREAETSSLVEARDLLVLVAEEAERLRHTVAHLASVRLSEAEEEADRILTEAVRTARELRSLGRAALETRLAESEQLTTAIRDLIRVLGSEPPPSSSPGGPGLGLVDEPPSGRGW